MLFRIRFPLLAGALAIVVLLSACSRGDGPSNRADITPDALVELQTELADLQEQVAALMQRADISPADLQALQDQVATLMQRADISPADLQALQDQVATLMQRADIGPADLQALQDQVATLMQRADIGPADLQALQDQVATLMQRADISPADLQALQDQVATLMQRADISPADLQALQDQVVSAKQTLADRQYNSAVANAIEKVTARKLRLADDGGSDTAQIRMQDAEAARTGTRYVSTSQTYRAGNRAFGVEDVLQHALVWPNAAGGLEVLVETHPDPLREDDPFVTTWSVLRSSYRNQSIDGISIQSHEAITDHGLGQEWQGIETVKEYDRGGTLTVRLFTDVQDPSQLTPPHTRKLVAADAEIFLTDDRVPDIPPGRDGLFVTIPEDGLMGTLDGVEGTFTCSVSFSCSLLHSLHETSGYVPWWTSETIVFTPDDANHPASQLARTVEEPSAEVAKVNYLTLGSWLYVPDDINDRDDFRFGLYAGGDDPFISENITALTGSATYVGGAVGMYADIVAAVTDTFTADVSMTADFGSTSEGGSIAGSASNFELGSGEPSPLEGPLQFWAYDFARSGNTISPGWPWVPDSNIPGGYVEGGIVPAEHGWFGEWGGRFFGNDPGDPSSHPEAFAGTFGATDGEHSFAGSFGAYKQ